MTQAQYIRDVTAFTRSLRSANIHTDLSIRPIGKFGTSLGGRVAARGYLLHAVIEQFDFRAGARLERALRYRIYLPGQIPGKDEPLIRLQSDKRGHPNNAHFAPNFMEAHFDEERWPDWLKPPDVFKVYSLFTMIVKSNGELPEPFRSA